MVLVLMSALFSASPLWDAATHKPVPYAGLDQRFGYLLFAPVFGIWDSLSLLTLNQHYAVLAALVLIYVVKRSRSWLGATRSKLSLPGRVGMEVVRALGALALLLGFYAAAMLLPRPMVGIALDGPDRLSVDFHSHTNHSHDGWSLFTAQRNRSWHEGGGFDVGYVTDHYTWQGVDDASLANPATVGERTVLLSGAEMRLRQRHTNLLGDRTRYAFAMDSTNHHLNPDSLSAAALRGMPAPTMIYTIPGPLDQIVPFTPETPAGVVAVELNDGAPRGLEQAKGERDRILQLADSMDLAVVAGANLHGWGRTVAAWSVLEIPGWTRASAAGAGRPDRGAVAPGPAYRGHRGGAPHALLRGISHSPRPHTALARVGAPAHALAMGARFVVPLGRVAVADGPPECASMKRTTQNEPTGSPLPGRA